MPDIRRRESAGDRPGGSALRSNELGAPFQADVFGETFELVEFDDPGGWLRPPVDAAGEPGNRGGPLRPPPDGTGGAGTSLQVPTRGTDAWDEEDEVGAVQDPDDLGDLNSTAGPDGQTAQADETCVAAFLGEVWDAAAACR